MESERGIGNRKSNNTNSTSDKTNHLLVIGIDNYTKGVPPLRNAVRDANAFKSALLNRFQFEEDHCTTLINEQATRKGLIEVFDKLIDTLTPDDNLLVYFSGHGELIERTNTSKGYWIPVDAAADDRSTYLSNDEIRDFFGNLQAHHVFGIIDSCFSGSLLLRSVKDAVASRFYTVPSRWIMTSGMKEPVSDGRGEHSPFAKSLLTQLNHHPKDAFSISELWLQMREGIVSNAKQTPLCQPINDVGHQGGEFFFLGKEVKIVPAELVASSGPTREIPVEPAKRDPNPIAVAPKEETPVQIPEDLAGLKKYLKKLIIQKKLDKAFDILFDKLSDDSMHQTTIMMRMSNYNGLKEDIANGTVQDEDRKMAQINQAVLYVISNMEEDDLN